MKFLRHPLPLPLMNNYHNLEVRSCFSKRMVKKNNSTNKSQQVCCDCLHKHPA